MALAATPPIVVKHPPAKSAGGVGPGPSSSRTRRTLICAQLLPSVGGPGTVDHATPSYRRSVATMSPTRIVPPPTYRAGPDPSSKTAADWGLPRIPEVTPLTTPPGTNG